MTFFSPARAKSASCSRRPSIVNILANTLHPPSLPLPGEPLPPVIGDSDLFVPCPLPAGCTGHGGRHLDAVLGRDLGHAFRSWWILGHRWCGSVLRFFAYLVEEPLVHSSGRLAHEHPAGLLSHVLVGVEIALRDVDQRPGHDVGLATFYQELVLALQHPEGLVLAVLDVGGAPAARG